MTVADQNASMVVNNQFVDALVKQMNGKVDGGLVLPKDYSLSNALNTAYLQLKQMQTRDYKPILSAVSQESVANALLDMATSGLDVSKSQGYFIQYGQRLQFQKSYFGWQTLARRCGAVKFSAQCIYVGDKFDYEVVDGEIQNVIHKQSFGNIDKDKILGCYGVVTMASGQKIIEVMTMDEIRQSWMQSKSGIGKVHTNFSKKMARKTVLTSICKSIVNTYGNAEMWEQINLADERSDEETEVHVNLDADLTDANSEILEMPDDNDILFSEEQPERVEAEIVEEDILPDVFKD
jgi:recombination protein RecT